MRSARYAVVNVPGIAIRLPLTPAGPAFFGATTIGPYLSPMLAPCGSSAYLSTRCAYAWNDTAVTSYCPSNAARLSDSMSLSTCSTTMPPVSTFPLASPKNMKASSESGLWATVMRVSLMMTAFSGVRIGGRLRPGVLERADDRADAVDGDIDLGVCRRPAETEADRSPGTI